MIETEKLVLKWWSAIHEFGGLKLRVFAADLCSSCFDKKAPMQRFQLNLGIFRICFS
jgi:hypothetical protein